MLLLGAAGPMSAPVFPSVFGIQMMTPISIPECQFSSIALKHPEAFRGDSVVEPYDYSTKVICYKRIGSRAGSSGPLINEALNVEYPFEQQPQLATYVSAEILDGKVQGVIFSTDGVSTQDLVLSSLEEKFGKPESLTTREKQNGFGAKFDVVNASWKLQNDVSVTFEGAASRLDAGVVSILSPAARAQEEQKRKQLLDSGTPL